MQELRDRYGQVAQLVEQQTCYLEVKGSSPFKTLDMLLRQRCSVSWLNARVIPHYPNQLSGNASLTVHTSWQETH